jgi:hypothetical protein
MILNCGWDNFGSPNVFKGQMNWLASYSDDKGSEYTERFPGCPVLLANCRNSSLKRPQMLAGVFFPAVIKITEQPTNHLS